MQTPTSSTPLENPVDSGDTATFSPEAMAMAGMSEEGAEAPPDDALRRAIPLLRTV